MNVVSYVTGRVGQLRDDEEGLALTEYLILLGLLAAAVIGAVSLFGQNLSATWTGWAEWINAEVTAPGGTTTDGETTDGVTTDGETTDGVTTDGETTDGVTTDGETTDGVTTQ